MRTPSQLVPVYRMHQSVFNSPCSLGDPCPTCAKHRLCQGGHYCSDCRRQKLYQCERATPAPPAFVVRVREAMRMVQHSMARFVLQNEALQLNYDQFVHLRDQSCRADEQVIFLYASRSSRARLAMDMAWGVPPEIAKYSSGHFGPCGPVKFRYYW